MASRRRITIPDLHKAKREGRTLVALTAYAARMAVLIDPFVDIILVGDTLGMTLYGMESTLGVTPDMMIASGLAVQRATKKAFIVVDLPFGSYEASPQQAFQTASLIIKQTGCQAVKLEGGTSQSETIRYLTQRGIPVMAHIGLQPQSVCMYGSYRPRGSGALEQDALLADAQAVAESGCFACVLEAVRHEVAEKILPILDMPVIGIGASRGCDGQILVTDDLLGLTAQTPSFVRQYANLTVQIQDAVSEFVSDVREKKFPDSSYEYR